MPVTMLPARGADEQWHGYQFKRKYTGHIGTATEPPFALHWDTGMIPDQSRPMAIKALIEFRNGIFCWSDMLDGLTFPSGRPRVQLYYCRDLPKPFHSRVNHLQTAWLELPDNISKAESAELHVRIWDGGEGTVKEPFTLNAIPYSVTAGTAPHDLIYTVNKVDPKNLKAGMNEIKVLSDTEHHGLEVSLPGPALIIRYKK